MEGRAEDTVGGCVDVDTVVVREGGGMEVRGPPRDGISGGVSIGR